MKKVASTLCNDSFLSVLKEFNTKDKFWIAYSGGMDSSVLLHLFFSNKAHINQSIEVIYVNHGLQEEAVIWEEFTRKQCEIYGFPITQLKITEPCPKGESIEAWAREKRYSLIENIMNRNDMLFTGHHQDDQVETFFLQALRGAGPRGLAAMPFINEKENITHVRPLLNYSRDALKRYADKHDLNWHNDKSNLDSRYDRNFLRHELIPIVEERWPAYRDTLSRLIGHQRETRYLLDEIANEDITVVKQGEALNLDIIKTLSFARQKNLIFVWLKQLGFKTPGSRHVEKIITDIINSDITKSPCVNWANIEIRRYKKFMYAQEVMQDHDFGTEIKWHPDTALDVFEETLTAKEGKGTGISKEKVKKTNFIVKFRKGGEKIRPNNSSHKKTVKQLFQERSVLPWYRDKIPLIYVNDDLAAIPGFCVDKKYIADKDEASWNICWSGYNKAIQL